MSHDKKIPSINPHLFKSSKKRKDLDVDALFKGIKAGDWLALSRGITLIESQSAGDKELAQRLIRRCLPLSGNSFRIGITGSPGVGKSTFIASLGLNLIEAGHQVAVLAVDPSSTVNKGSILGDKTRMGRLAVHEKSFIRPSPAGTSLGGVARATRESVILCEAAGFDRILIETVGVGQSEVTVHSMVDFFLLMLLPGGGDELQGIKRGVMEMADLIVINKADGERKLLAEKSKNLVQNALHILPPKQKVWRTPVETISALEQKKINRVIKLTDEYLEITQAEGLFGARRKQQAVYWLEAYINYQLKNTFFNHPLIHEKYDAIKANVRDNQLSPFDAADELFQIFLKGNS